MEEMEQSLSLHSVIRNVSQHKVSCVTCPCSLECHFNQCQLKAQQLKVSAPVTCEKQKSQNAQHTPHSLFALLPWYSWCTL